MRVNPRAQPRMAVPPELGEFQPHPHSSARIHRTDRLRRRPPQMQENLSEDI